MFKQKNNKQLPTFTIIAETQTEVSSEQFANAFDTEAFWGFPQFGDFQKNNCMYDRTSLP